MYDFIVGIKSIVASGNVKAKRIQVKINLPDFSNQL